MNKKLVWYIALGILLVALVGYFIFDFYGSSIQQSETIANSFKVNNILLKFTISQGDFVSAELKITNFEDSQSFKLQFDNLGGIVTLDEYEFVLEPWEEKLVDFKIKGSLDNVPGIYAGFLIVETNSEIKHIPVIIDVQSINAPFATNLITTPDYKELIPGDNLFTEIRIFNLFDSKNHQVKVTSLVKNFNGETIVMDSEQRVVGVETSVSKTIALPEDLAFGNYVFGVITEFEGAESSSSFLFEVVKEKKGSGFSWTSDSFTIIFAGAIFIILLFIIILVFYLMRERDKLFSELKSQHNRELKVLISELDKRKRKQLGVVKEVGQKKLVEGKFSLIKKKVLGKVRDKQKQQKIIFKSLKRHKRRSEMQRKLVEWKNQGVDTSEIDVLTRGVEKDLKKSVSDLKKQGYHA